MADTKISGMTAGSTPLAGTELVPLVQSGGNVQTSVANLTAGRSVSALNYVVTGATVPANGMYLSAANTLAWSTNSAVKMTLDTNGKLALGGAASGATLDIANSTANKAMQIAQIASATATAGLNIYSNVIHTGNTGNALLAVQIDNASSTGTALYVQQDGTGYGAIITGGNVGIGNATPAVPLDVTGAVAATGSATAASFIPSGSTVPTNGMYLSAANTLSFATSSARQVTINGSGLGIGMTPTVALDITGGRISLANSANNGAALLLTSSFTNGRSWHIGSNSIVGNGELTIYDATSSAARLSFSATGQVSVNGNLGRGAPVTKTGDFTLAATENWVIVNQAGTTTVTLPAASSWTGREVMFKTIQAQTLVSASSNVVPQAGGAAGTAILAGTAGNWATLVSDGTNWVVMQGGGLL